MCEESLPTEGRDVGGWRMPVQTKSTGNQLVYDQQAIPRSFIDIIKGQEGG